MMDQRSQPARGPSQPDDKRNYDSSGIVGQMANYLKTGWGHVTLLKKSLRVGGGTGLASLDGSDGTIVASGALAQLVLGDVATPSNSNYLAIYRTGTTGRFDTQAGQMWSIDLTTGYIAQPSWIAVSGGVGFKNSWANFGGTNATAAYRKNLPSGDIEIKGFVKSGGANTVFTLPSAYKPSEDRNFQGSYFNAAWTQTPLPFVIQASTGDLIMLVAPAAGAGVSIECRYSI